MHVTAIYPGTFDPMTLGHVDIARRAAGMFDELVIAPAGDSGKNPFFSLDERVALARQCLDDVDNVSVQPFRGLLVEFAEQIGASVIVRGLRAISDFDYEVQIAGMNRQLAPRVETIFISASQEFTFLSSSIVREIAGLGGDVEAFVHPAVNRALLERGRS